MNVMQVKCISKRGMFPKQIEVNETYYLNPNTIIIDMEGDAYADIYYDNELTEVVGTMKLSHFRTVSINY